MYIVYIWIYNIYPDFYRSHFQDVFLPRRRPIARCWGIPELKLLASNFPCMFNSIDSWGCSITDSLNILQDAIDYWICKSFRVRVPLCQSILNSYPMNWKLKMADSQLSVRIGKQQNRETPIRNKMELLGQRDR